MSGAARTGASIEARLGTLRLVPVVSLPSVDAGLRLADILVECGLPIAEVTFRTPCAAEAIRAMKGRHKELTLLAGTVLTPEQAEIAWDSGAECIVMPGYAPELVSYCLEHEMMVCPGTATPSEVLQCLGRGIDLVKFFPAEIAGGIAMLKALSLVYSEVRFMPTGGINMGNLRSYLALESVFCCGGSWLAPEQLMREGAWQDVRERIVAALAEMAEKEAEA